MEISINNIPSESLINTVSVQHNIANPNNLLFFRCYKCGTGISQIQGSIKSINAGFIPTDDAVVINRCYKCQENYTFQTFPVTKLTYTKITISSLKPVNTFHCIICRMQLLQYNIKGAVLLPDFKPITMQGSFPCFNPICKMSYLLSDIVETDIVL